MVDEVLRGIAGSDFADVLFRAAAFARVVATGRAALDDASEAEVQRMLVLAEQLEAAGHAGAGARSGLRRRRFEHAGPGPASRSRWPPER